MKKSFGTAQTNFLAKSALLCALAIVFGILESFLSPFMPIPGIKPGFANLIILISLYLVGSRMTLAVSLIRIVVCAIYQGSFPAFLYSLAGAVLSICCMMLLKKVFTVNHVWIISVFGALAHNLGQILVASLLLGSKYAFYYAPILIASGIAAGVITGICASAFLRNAKQLYQSRRNPS